jgi:hypothetical protein
MIHTKEELRAVIGLPPEIEKHIMWWIDEYIIRQGSEGIDEGDITLNLIRVLPMAINLYLKEVVEEIKKLKNL